MAEKTQDLEARIKELEAENENLKAAADKRTAVEKRVAEKMAAGLSREHAEQAVKFQDLTDEQEAADKAKAAEKAKLVEKAKPAEPAATKSAK